MPHLLDIICGTLAPSAATVELFKDMRDAPIHVKRFAQRISMGAVCSLLLLSPQLRENILLARRMLEDATFYADIPVCSQRDVPFCNKLTPDHVEQLLDAGIFERVPTDEVKGIRGFINSVFNVPEFAKRRFRNIQHTKTCNDVLPPAPKVAFTSLQQRKGIPALEGANFMLQLDFSGFYTQFSLATEVRNFHCVRFPNPAGGKALLCRLCVAPTGQSHMVFAASTVTRALLSFAQQSVFQDDHIDNVLFVGATREAVIADAAQLIARCKLAGVTINEDVSDLAALVATSGDWCGIHLDLTNDTVALTEKVVSKLRLSLSNATAWTWRGFAAHIGLLFYAMQILDIQVSTFFNLLRFHGRVSREMQAAADELWDEPAVIDPSAMRDIFAWSRIALTNDPEPSKKKSSCNVLMMTDASALGWGYVAFDEVSQRVFYGGGQWPAYFAQEHGQKLGSSVFTEPYAIFFAKQHLFAELPNTEIQRHLRIGTDSVTAASILRKGFTGRSYDLNAIAAQDRKFFSGIVCDYIYVEGKNNFLADRISRRHKITSKEYGTIEACLRRYLGESPADLTPHSGGGNGNVV